MAKFYVIPKELAPQFKQVILEWWKGVDATEIKDGSYIISEWAYNELKKYNRTITVADKEVSVATELVKYPLVDEKNVIFKEPEAIEQIIPK